MRLLERPPVVASPRSEVSQSFRLRMRADGRIVDLPLGKTAIGSGPRCNVRIQAPGVQPIHCLVVHAAEGLSVRRWAGEARLNGEPFDESMLDAGDCLSVGSVELEIVDARVKAAPEETAPATASSGQMADRLRTSRDAARARIRKLLAALRNDRTSHRELSQHVVELQEKLLRVAAEGERAVAKLEDATIELAMVRKQAEKQAAEAAERQNLAGDTQELTQKVGELTERIELLNIEITELSAARQALEEEKLMLAEESERFLEETIQAGERCEQLTTQNAALYRDIDDHRRKAEQIYAELREMADEKSMLSDEQALILAERDELLEQVKQLQADARALAKDKVSLAEERSSLAEKQAELCGERDGYRRQCEQLQSSVAALTEEKEALSEELEALHRECNEYRQKCEELKDFTDTWASEKAALAEEVESRSNEHSELRRQCDKLQAEIEAMSAEKSVLAKERSSLTSECERLRQEATRVDELERKVREVVADRENTSSELYRALLQLAEMKEHDDHHVSLAAAHQALNEELEKSTQEVADLQQQIERLQTEHAAAEEARQTLAAQTAEFSEARQLLADKNDELTASLSEARQELVEAQEQREELVAQLQAAEAWRQSLEVTDRSQAALIEEVARLESELAARSQEEASASAQLARREQESADQAQQIANAAETIRQLEQKLAAAEQEQSVYQQAREEWQCERTNAARQAAQFAKRIAELERQLAETSAAATSATASTVPPAEQVENTASAGEFGSAQTNDASSGFDWSSMRTDGGGGVATQSEVFGSSSDSVEEADHFATSQTESAMDAVSPTAGSEEGAEKFEPASFIERYSHMFADDKAPSDESPTPCNEQRPVPTSSGPMLGTAPDSASGASSAPSAGGEDEESIEQYMAKLLQRLRGDSQESSSPEPTQPARSTQTSGSQNQSAMAPVPGLAASVAMTSTIGESHPLNVPAPNLEPVVRRTSILAPQTDLEALRALANETARRAISRHALRKHRRNAVTKVIVSALAGVTSLWLMLEPPHWLSVQFLTGCLLLMVAAYWAGETFRTLLESLRAAAYDGPEDEEEMSEFTAQLISPLPIDVETGLEREPADNA